MVNQWTGEVTDPIHGFNLGVKTIQTHHISGCRGRYCSIHEPSDHHMRQWPMMYRADKGLMERRCPHGIGHPDPDDVAFHKTENREWVVVHGCDGCCNEPGQQQNSS